MKLRCIDFKRLLYLQLADLWGDYYALYEQFWALPDGSRKSLVSDYEKIISEKELSELLIKLQKKEYIELYEKQEKDYKIYKESEIIFRNMENWRSESPQFFYISSGPNYEILMSYLSRAKLDSG